MTKNLKHIRLHVDDLPRNRRTVDLTLHENGSLRLDAQDIGSEVERLLGDSDYEFWADIAAIDVPALCFALLREKYSGRTGAVDELAQFCAGNAIPCAKGDWI